MTDKIEEVINKICQNPQDIKDVISSGNEYYFRYKNHSMSIMRRTTHSPTTGEHSLFLYPVYEGDLGELASDLEHSDPSDLGIKMASYHSISYDKKLFQNLYALVDKKYLSLDDIFDDILSDD